MNKVILMGRLTRDPEVRYSNNASGTTIARYTLAVDRKFKREGEPDADFLNCTVFGKGAEFAEKWLRQGTKILVTGRIQQDNYTNRDGQKVYSIQVLVEEQEFAESKSASAEGTAGTQSSGSRDNISKSQPQYTDESGFMNIPDGLEDELPFN